MSKQLDWGPQDTLGEALHLLRMRSVFYCRSDFTEPWGVDIPRIEGSLMFHFVTSGRCHLETRDGNLHPLQRGDLVLIPQATGHKLSSDPGIPATPLFDIPRDMLSDRFESICAGGGGAATQVICGAVRFDEPAAQQLIHTLPPVIKVDTMKSPHLEWINSLLRFMAAEAAQLRPGGEAVITRLADILVVQTLRTWMERDPAAKSGWLGALQDKQIGRALAGVHRNPGAPWTLESLADAAAMSRSAFAARFTAMVGEPPKQYVTRWRMRIAQSRLAQGEALLAELANELGYESEAAFSRAFKRLTGSAPGTFRKASQPEAALHQ